MESNEESATPSPEEVVMTRRAANDPDVTGPDDVSKSGFEDDFKIDDLPDHEVYLMAMRVGMPASTPGLEDLDTVYRRLNPSSASGVPDHLAKSRASPFPPFLENASAQLRADLKATEEEAPLPPPPDDSSTEEYDPSYIEHLTRQADYQEDPEGHIPEELLNTTVRPPFAGEVPDVDAVRTPLDLGPVDPNTGRSRRHFEEGRNLLALKGVDLKDAKELLALAEGTEGTPMVIERDLSDPETVRAALEGRLPLQEDPVTPLSDPGQIQLSGAESAPVSAQQSHSGESASQEAADPVSADPPASRKGQARARSGGFEANGKPLNEEANASGNPKVANAQTHQGSVGNGSALVAGLSSLVAAPFKATAFVGRQTYMAGRSLADGSWKLGRVNQHEAGLDMLIGVARNHVHELEGSPEGKQRERHLESLRHSLRVINQKVFVMDNLMEGIRSPEILNIAARVDKKVKSLHEEMKTYVPEASGKSFADVLQRLMEGVTRMVYRVARGGVRSTQDTVPPSAEAEETAPEPG